MQFEVRFYSTRSGDKPVGAFLKSLKQSDPILHNLVLAGIARLKDRSNHAPPLTKVVDKKLKIHELRVGGVNIARIFFFFRPRARLLC